MIPIVSCGYLTFQAYLKSCLEKQMQVTHALDKPINQGSDSRHFGF